MFEGFTVRDPDRVDPPSDGLDRLELAFWTSGHVVWSEPMEPIGVRHRVARASPERVHELVRLVEQAIDSDLEHPGLEVDAEEEQVCARTEGRDSVTLLQRVFSLRNEVWDESLPVWYSDNPPPDVKRERDRERYPERIAFLSAWHAVREQIRAALPKDGELVDRAKLAALGLR